MLSKSITKSIMSAFFYFVFCFLPVTQAFAWNAMGHRITGEIAFENLTPSAKIQLGILIDYLSNAYPYSSSFQTANAWADYLKQDNIHVFDAWHFYNKVYGAEGYISVLQAAPAISPPNLLWALNESLSILKGPRTNQYEKALFVRFLLHLTGDAHQPLHCIDYFSPAFSQGDQGGNLFRVQDSRYSNLHAAWDDGLGLFRQKCRTLFSNSKSSHAKCLAEKFQRDYPKTYFGQKIDDLNPADWITQSYNLARNNAYQIKPDQPLSQQYIHQNQPIAEQQIVLGAYRLASVLNTIYK